MHKLEDKTIFFVGYNKMSKEGMHAVCFKKENIISLEMLFIKIIGKNNNIVTMYRGQYNKSTTLH